MRYRTRDTVAVTRPAPRSRCAITLRGSDTATCWYHTGSALATASKDKEHLLSAICFVGQPGSGGQR